MWSRFDDNLNVRIFTRHVFKVFDNKSASIGRGRPGLAVFEDHLSTLWNKYLMAIGWV